MQSIESLRTEINVRLDQLERLEAAFGTETTAPLAPRRGRPPAKWPLRAIQQQTARVVTAARKKSMKLQGQYLGLLRGLKKTDPKRVKAKAIAKKDGVEAAIKFLKK